MSMYNSDDDFYMLESDTGVVVFSQRPKMKPSQQTWIEPEAAGLQIQTNISTHIFITHCRLMDSMIQICSYALLCCKSVPWTWDQRYVCGRGLLMALCLLLALQQQHSQLPVSSPMPMVQTLCVRANASRFFLVQFWRMMTVRVRKWACGSCTAIYEITKSCNFIHSLVTAFINWLPYTCRFGCCANYDFPQCLG